MEPVTATSEERFRALLVAGDERAAAEWLVGRYAGEVFGLCAAMVRDRTAAEDLAQDAFGRAFASLGGFRAEASSRTWLLAIARNRCIDFLRARRRDPWAGSLGDEAAQADFQPDEAPLPLDLLSRRGEVETALSALSEGERALVVLRFGHGLEYGELAAAFGLRPATVRMRVSRALARMRVALEAQPSARPAEPGAPSRSPAERARRHEPPARPAARSAAPETPPEHTSSRGPVPAAPGGALPLPPPLRRPTPARPMAARPAGKPLEARGRVGRLGGLGAPAGPYASAGPSHPLAAYLAAVDEGVPSLLLARLAEGARALRALPNPSR